MTLMKRPRAGTALAFYDQARQALAQAARVDEVKAVRDRAEALRCYSRQVGESFTLQNFCAEIKIRAERRAGELLREMVKHPPGPDPFQPGRDLPPRLQDLGLSYAQAHRWQTIASLPDEHFEAHLAQAKAAGKELTSAAYREARKRQPVRVRPPTPRSPPRDPVDARGRTPYVQWVTGLRQLAALLEAITRLGGFDAIITRLTPAQVDAVIEDVHRVHRQVQVLVGEVTRVGPVIKVPATPV